MLNEQKVTENLLKSFSENIGFPVYTADELQKMYEVFDVDPKSLDRRVFDTESLSHHTQTEVLKLLKMMNISKDDLLLDAGCGNGAPTRLIAKSQ
ncbi:MAG: hypothetical protein HY934_10670 [Candidatus Firestonebacteria bacterium]|nr:hypothetical protein [Candidatus Firestonebacteria bacterium]